MHTLQTIILLLSTYPISLIIRVATNYTIIKMLAQNNYTAKNGDLSKVYEDINYATFKTSKYLNLIPFYNVVFTCIETSINLAVYKKLESDLIERKLIVPLSGDERKYFNTQNQSYKAAIAIARSRERELQCQEEYSIIEHTFKEELLSKDTSQYEKLNNISNAKISYQHKIELLNILKYSIINEINNLNIEKLIESIEKRNNIFDPYYLYFFYLQNEIDNVSVKTILTSINKVINDDNQIIEEKEYYLAQVYLAINNYKKALSKYERKRMNLKINLNVNNDNIEDSNFTIEKEPKNKVKQKEHQN